MSSSATGATSTTASSTSSASNPAAAQSDGCGNGPVIGGPLPQPPGWAGAMAGLEAELVDEAVVEVLAVAEFDIVHLLEEGQGGGAVAD